MDTNIGKLVLIKAILEEECYMTIIIYKEKVGICIETKEIER